MAEDVLTIRMQSGGVECWLCGVETECRWGVPVFNGDLVSNDFPDHLYERHGGCEAVCRKCYEKHERGELQTYDHYYVRPGFRDGDGI